MTQVVEYAQIQGTDGKWYRPRGGMPHGVKWNGERRVAGYVAMGSDGITYGRVFPTREEAQAVVDAENERMAAYDRILQEVQGKR